MSLRPHATYVKPYVKTNKNDLRDAEAIAEAVTRPSMRFVPIKEVDQQDIQALHRVRERLMGARTALINEMRGLLAEYGIVLPKGAKAFRKAVVGKLDAEQAKLTPLGQELFHRLFDELVQVEAEVAYYEEKLLAIAEAHPECQRLLTIPGIGPLTATALTHTIRLGTAVTVLPFHNPIHIAEETATVDLLSDGRLELGVGRGYQWGEFHRLNIPMAEADERFQEAMEVLIKAWTAREPFDHRGTYWTFNDMTIHPRPVQSPHPPVWVAATSPGSMDRIAQQHWNLLIGQGEPFQQVADQLAYFKRAVMEAGDAYDPGRVKVARAMYTAPTAEQARQDAEGPFTWFRKTSHAVGAPPGRRTALLPDNYERYRQRFAAETAFDYDDMQDRVILFGSPGHVAERVDRLRQSGADQLILFVNYGGIDNKKVMNSLELFASKVMPQFAD